MITLRRATTSKSSRRTELTFFPEPKFSHERSGLLSYLVSTFTKVATSSDKTSLFPIRTRRSSDSTASAKDGSRRTLTSPAATVYTETTIDASLAMPGLSHARDTMRRCSTKYVSNNVTYEIIWDDNDNSSVTQSSPQPSVSDRRLSLAVLKLESQLASSKPSTRRASELSRKSSVRRSYDSVDMFPERKMTHERLEQLFPALLHRSGLRDLPRSRQARQRRSTVCSITIDEPQQQILTGDGSREGSTGIIDFFPPFSGPISDTANLGDVHGDENEPEEVGQGRRLSESYRWQSRSSFGSLIGSSSRIHKQRLTQIRRSSRQESTRHLLADNVDL